jgi:hypothetical protein
MGLAKEAQPVKLVVGMLSGDEQLFDIAESCLVELFGPVDDRSSVLSFESTDYYEGEMGPHLLRRFLAFGALVDPGALPGIKLQTNAMEMEMAIEGRRRINLDPGYISAGKMVLATTKDWQHRLYLGEGIYGEVTLRFRRGTFEPWEWTYPDYRTEEYIRILNRFRRSYMEQLRCRA